MSYKIEKNESYFVVEFWGSTTLEENEQARQELNTKLNEDKINAVLVEMTHADLSEVGLEDLLHFGKGWEGLLNTSTTKFATLVPSQNPFRDKIDLSLWVGMMKGVQLKIFEEKELAINWLAS